MTTLYTQPSPALRQELLKNAGEPERYVREKERQKITTISRVQAWEMERKGLHPKRVKLSSQSVAWLLSDLLWFLYRHTKQQNDNTQPKDA
ncbi:MAG: AlpA family phage regulatory protein [Psychrobium sp.]|nr:AlpA family phage regulatory protein [Psychrobium sp.]